MSSLTHRTIRGASVYRSHGASHPPMPAPTPRLGQQRVVTLTPSPVVDRIYFFEDFVPGAVNRASAVEESLGGNGINVARTLKLAGNPTTAVIPASEADQSRAALLQSVSAPVATVPVSTSFRVNTVLVDSQGTTTNANQRPGILPKREWQSVCETTLREVQALNADWLVVAGALPVTEDGQPADLECLLREARAIGTRVCLDVNGPDLNRWAATGLVNLVKPNVPELESFAGKQLATVGDVVRAAEELRKAGVGAVLASMGADGLIGSGPDGILWARAPKTTVVNTTGAGDAALAGFLSEACVEPEGPTGPRNRAWSFSESLARSAAWGALAVGRSTTALGTLTGAPAVSVQAPEENFRLGTA
ncbi:MULTISPECIES: 1-phosphofructokinase family hexose kinase [Paenarthrobacter]|uniref:1-phosphofructokinase family hexose kinase n=1 Tax=Paenarthrobacter TaxID=1742992 RepID=UPI000B28C7E0|nr:PfkB family carbohydrate kinase [Paenarthrobacter ureafaciens]RWW94398.1 1-phosphofructokinase family hexose kinase [Paenarthrobacter ureafaciens]BCW85715.1 1-phosphofructokinase [Arthrobacter sp. NicSoilE8]